MAKPFNGYFTDRNMNVLGLVSTTNPGALKLVSDEEVETIEKGVTTFKANVSTHSDLTDKNVLSMIAAGNYFLYEGEDGQSKVFTIIETSHEAPNKDAFFYGEDGGLDIINEIVDPYEAKSDMVIAKYFELFLKNTGFKIGVNELGSSYSRKLAWEGEATVTERLRSVAHQFEHAEINFSFVVKGMRVTEKYVNIYKNRGEQTGITLELNKDINQIISTETIADLATSLYPKGEPLEGKDEPITLKGHKYDDGRFFVENGFLRDRESNELWSRFLSEGRGAVGGYINRPFSYQTKNVVTLRNTAITELKKVSQPAKNFEVDISILPDDIRIGDTINIVNQAGELYLEARVLQLTRSRSEDSATAILGDYLIKDSGINERLKELAEMMGNIPKGDSSSLWIRYADDDKGNGFSASPANKKFVAMKTAINNPVPSEDPADYQGLWAKFMGPEGESIEGPPGKDGQPTYTWIRYADNVSGGGISAESAGKKYIGFAYNKDTATPSNVAKDYQWFLAKGEDGADGKNGLSITSVQSLFYQSTSATSLTGGTWVTTAPVWESGKFSWTKTKTVFSDSTSSETTPVNITGGVGSDGKPTYSWLMYAEDDNGKGISASPVGKYYMGLAHNKSVEKPSTVPADYTWSAMYDEKKMAELQEQLNNLNYVGTNLWAPDFYKDNIGYIGNDDLIVNNDGYRYTEYIPTADFKKITRTVFAIPTAATGMRYHFYDKDKNPISYIQPNVNQLGSITTDIPDNTAFVRFYATPKFGGKIKVELGNKATDYSISPLDTPTTGDLSNVQTELQQQLNTIVMPVTQPTAPSTPKEGMVWWQDDLKGDIIGMFKYISNHWVPQTIQQSMLSIIELYAVRIIGATITGTEIAGSTIISAFDNTVVQGSPIRQRGTLTLDKGYALIKYEQYNENTPNVVINKGETRMDEYGISTVLKDKNDNVLVSSQYGPMGININDRSKTYGTVNLGYNDLISIEPAVIPNTWFTSKWEAYATGVNQASTPKITRQGRVIQMFGAIKPKSPAYGGTSQEFVMALPEQFRPAGTVSLVQQGSGYDTFLMQIESNGNVSVSRHRTLTEGGIDFPTGFWANIACTFTTNN